MKVKVCMKYLSTIHMYLDVYALWWLLIEPFDTTKFNTNPHVPIPMSSLYFWNKKTPCLIHVMMFMTRHSCSMHLTCDQEIQIGGIPRLKHRVDTLEKIKHHNMMCVYWTVVFMSHLRPEMHHFCATDSSSYF